MFFMSLNNGFRERRSTDHAILDIVNKIQSYMDKGMFSCGVFIRASGRVREKMENSAENFAK